MNAHDTPRGTRMMWKPRVNAICDRAHGTGSTAMTWAARLMSRAAGSGQSLGLQACVFGVVDDALGLQVGELGQFIGGARPILLHRALDVLTGGGVLRLRCLGGVLRHLVAPGEQVHED